MKCPKCGFEQIDGSAECMKCGIVFEKYLKCFPADDGNAHALDQDANAGQTQCPVRIPVSAPFQVSSLQGEEEWNPFSFGGRVIVFLGILVLGLRLMFSSLEDLQGTCVFLHLINLPFHEAGHIFFQVLGRFMASLGGTLGQLLMPAVCMVAFLVKTRDIFGASVCLWWLGENFLDIAPYINDANRLELSLLGGNTGRSAPYGFHDWEFILTETGLVEHSHAIALSSVIIGDIIMAAALLWAGYILFRPFLLNRRFTRSHRGRACP
ncbi:MAG TPA: zinc ribbon domain-containing protein [Deltaproteobacteria bacterium]|jgi:hypothetical protein|nr:zinc ribbon domain-containing protein [Deltaproteobacteria bacterium]HOS27022.1 zinc ribbon domain-containing protein [Deltaproteobacteria bacterium]HPL87183.1 zinc ribbon domain-containing protein [Deltaproteobacteria bacterium]